MIELRFSGDAAVVRQEMLTMLGIGPISQEAFREKLISMSAEASVEVAKRLGVDLADNPLPQPDASAAPDETPKTLPGEAPKTRARRGSKTEETANPPLAPSDPDAPAPSSNASVELELTKDVADPVQTEKTTASPSEVILDFVKDVRPAFEAFGKLVGPTPLQALVASFGVRRASEIPAERFPEVLKAIADKTADAMKG